MIVSKNKSHLIKVARYIRESALRYATAAESAEPPVSKLPSAFVRFSNPCVCFAYAVFSAEPITKKEQEHYCAPVLFW